ncbi:Cyclic nucleotide-gated ion channel 4 [Hibiscus syriacus]|uniref:Cyclic nucleotide-gated ion channel 4 n=1 Tax=Hibiscus syriacus TaxID=106335 RepID=A0A6A2YI09_HIBSY|nr:cyclic nucleotide-gated ion channel 4-like [Hibiscus syriacus]KAE8680166.1 Cyclic nucleotide-gated ion channel 4 [Hibiscus syriacus]
MENEREISFSRATHTQYFTGDDEEEKLGDTEDEEDLLGNEEEESSRDSRRLLFTCGGGCRRRTTWSLGQVFDPRAKWFQEWNRVFRLVCATGLFVDPLFFYALSVSETCMCLFVDGWFAITVTALRCMTDALHVWNMWLQLKMINRSSDARRHDKRSGSENEEERDGRGERSNRPRGGASARRRVAFKYLKAKKGFFFDLFVILPLPQIVLWVAIPSLLEKGSVTLVTTVFLIIFLFQYLPKIYHSVCLLRRLQNLSGYIFGTVWWGIALNLIAYFVASHAVGACWYLLGIKRSAKCLKEQCRGIENCDMRLLACKDPIYYGTRSMMRDRARLLWAENKQARSICIEGSDNYDYGAYKWTVQLVTNESRLEKILFPIFWGLMTLSTFGNLESTTEWLEVVFNIIVLTSGLLLVTMLIGNIKVFLHATTSKKQAMQLKMRNIEWWMRKRRLPSGFRHRVRNYERQRWAAMRGVDECEMIKNLPEGLRRDIKYHLCLDLVRQVPLFQHMDDLVLENICDRVKSLIFTKGETITREGDPVQRMLFVVRGHLQSSQVLRDGVKSCCMLGPGNFSGDELLSWCLRRPLIERLPPSCSTLVTLETTEAFSLEAEDVKYVTQHFRYTFINEKIQMSARYYSPGWRTWAAVAIQLAWRRYKHRLTLTSLSFIRPRRPLSRSNSLGEDRLRLYTAMLTSPKPNQEDFYF